MQSCVVIVRLFKIILHLTLANWTSNFLILICIKLCRQCNWNLQKPLYLFFALSSCFNFKPSTNIINHLTHSNLFKFMLYASKCFFKYYFFYLKYFYNNVKIASMLANSTFICEFEIRMGYICMRVSTAVFCNMWCCACNLLFFN